jgi:hypothetical protein
VLQGPESAADKGIVPKGAVLIQQQDRFATRSYARVEARGLDLHEGNKTVNFRFFRYESRQYAAQAKGILAKRRSDPIFATAG